MASNGTEDHHEDGKSHHLEHSVHQRLRANSSIMQLKKILVANRGEIPIRIFRTAHELSLQTVAVYSYEDRLGMHRQKADEAYMIGKRGQYTPVAAYLAGDEIIKIALAHGVQMIHPGYGFLSENSEFARKVEEAGIIFVGPSYQVIEALGDKVSARRLAMKCDVPCVPGTEGPVAKFEEVKSFTDQYGFPIIIKAAFGGGGRGMRVVRDQESLKDSFERATSEAKSAFGNGTVFVERFLDKPKHIEVQLLGDNHGNVVHLYERDCSVQRRHQKVVELAPAKDLPAETRDAILNDAVKLAKSVNYRNAGTAEFLVDQQNRYYFIEINPRIQVEHTITEEITGIDIVAAQIQIAAGASLEQLGLTQDRISTRGFAIQCRITTEDPQHGFAPDTGKIEVYRSAGGNGVRLDGGNGFAGAIITPHYDSMLVKCTCHGSTYEIVRRKMLRALVEFRIRGVKTNIPFLASLLTHPTFIEGNCWTTFIDDTPELFKLIGSQNRAQKLLQYLGDLAVNGSSIKGQIGESKFKGDIVYPTLLDDNGKAIDVDVPCTKGWKSIIDKEGPQGFAKAVRANKGCLIMDTTWRDAHQSLLATRVRTVDLCNIAKHTSHALANAWALENWGGATFDVAMRFLFECPWDRLRKMRKLVPNIPFQMLLRGANGVAYKSLPDNAIYQFCKQAKRNGMDIFRVFDALNDIEQLEVGMRAVQEAGGVLEATVCYSGDMLAFESLSLVSSTGCGAAAAVKMMAPTPTLTIFAYAVWLGWMVLFLTPNALKNAHYAVFFPNPRRLLQILMSSSLEFAPGLLEALQSETAPRITFFKTLPLHLSRATRAWAVYLLVLKKQDCRPRLYIGSGTQAVEGVSLRFWQYDNKVNLPLYLGQSLDEGYKITHKGLLCWGPIPDMVVKVPTRAGFLLLETVFTLIFWAMKSRTKDYYMPRICPWPIDSLEYDGLCTHFSIYERVLGAAEYKEQNLTPEEIEQIELLCAEKLREKARDNYYKSVANGTFEARRAETLASKKYFCSICNKAFHTLQNHRVHNLSQKHLKKAGGIVKPYKNPLTVKNVATKRFFCSVCDYAAQDRAALKIHLDSKRHLKKVAESNGQINEPQTLHAKNIATKRYYCSDCGYAAAKISDLRKHCKTSRHLKKVAESNGQIYEPDPLREKTVVQIRRDKNIAEKKYYCSDCDYAAADGSYLETHFKSQMHLKKVAESTKSISA